MLPKFKTVADWEQAEILMQPCLIRVIDNIRKQLEESKYQGSYQEITEPIPGYQLTLTNSDVTVIVNIWELCFKVCFQDYQPSSALEVKIDHSLIDETGLEVDWQSLETKAQYHVNQVFLNLPQI